MTATATELVPVWHARLEPQSLYSPTPVFRAVPALLDRQRDRLTTSSLNAELEHLAYFEVRAYVESSESGPRLWGFQHGYAEPFFVDLYRADVMIKTLRRIEKELKAHQARFGSIDAGDAVGYLAVIASALRLERFVIEGDGPDRIWACGVQHRLVDAGTLKSIVGHRVGRLDLN